MSYDIKLCYPVANEPGEYIPAKVPGHQEGGIVRAMPLYITSPMSEEDEAEFKRNLLEMASWRLPIIPSPAASRVEIIPIDTHDAEINITYNYSQWFREALDTEQGIRWLYGQPARRTIERLQSAVNTLGTDQYTGHNYVVGFPATKEQRDMYGGIDYDDPANAMLLERGLQQGIIREGGAYWKATPGNAGHVLNVLLEWARQHPDAVWMGD